MRAAWLVCPSEITEVLSARMASASAFANWRKPSGRAKEEAESLEPEPVGLQLQLDWPWKSAPL
jgi:hypothetical protein